eukprot:TRINITY_DN1836_c0_g1_i1.p1 TRINITY_DN1836_c0_g1~~TRINITY_DN1836_c0_g1_i1.p1  ORF type:complete len:497 (+),score=178.99 TRINITY_DN1836_c0_g1_i1:133-1491(+)
MQEPINIQESAVVEPLQEPIAPQDGQMRMETDGVQPEGAVSDQIVPEVGEAEAKAEQVESDSSDASEDSGDSDVCLDEMEDMPMEEDDYDPNFIPRTKNEIEPIVEEIDVSIDPEQPLEVSGVITMLVENSIIVVEASPNAPLLDLDNILIFEDRSVLGKIEEVFGPVKRPFYSVRIRADKHLGLGGYIGKAVCHLKEKASFAVVTYVRGSDASNSFDEEPKENELEFSDDEEQRLVEKKRTEKKKREAQEKMGDDFVIPPTDQFGRPTNQRGRGRGKRQRGGGHAAFNPAPRQMMTYDDYARNNEELSRWIGCDTRYHNFPDAAEVQRQQQQQQQQQQYQQHQQHQQHQQQGYAQQQHMAHPMQPQGYAQAYPVPHYGPQGLIPVQDQYQVPQQAYYPPVQQQQQWAQMPAPQLNENGLTSEQQNIVDYFKTQNMAVSQDGNSHGPNNTQI